MIAGSIIAVGALKPIIHPYQAIMAVQLCSCYGSGSGPIEHTIIIVIPLPSPTLPWTSVPLSLITMASIKTHPCVTNIND